MILKYITHPFVIVILVMVVFLVVMSEYNGKNHQKNFTSFKIKNVPDKVFYVEYRSGRMVHGYYLNDFGTVEKVEILQSSIIPIYEIVN